MRYIYFANVVSVTEHFETVSGRKNEQGQVDITHKSLGWFVRVTESSAIHVGMEKPDIKVGDRIKITYEVVR